MSLPHARGGVSHCPFSCFQQGLSSPRTWGCFRFGIMLADAEVGLPHARGGVSKTPFHDVHSLRSSPRTWGCFPAYRRYLCWLMVFPTHVGVFLSIYAFASHMLSLPHARGGVSICLGENIGLLLSSPRTWGCFSMSVFYYKRLYVFPTHVGVFLIHWLSVTFNFCLPHARGGVSFLFQVFTIKAESSPRTWGCFL